MSNILVDPSISNGTCWTGPNRQADRIYIPCGNTACGHQSCCQARDLCLSSNACYNARWGVTYIAGCSDQTYSNTTFCPIKSQYQGQQWVGLVRCFVSNDTNQKSEEWAACEDKDQPIVTSPNPCTCDSKSRTAVFTDGPTLTAIASLPVSVGNAIAWFSGFTPSTTMTLDTSQITDTSKLSTTAELTPSPTVDSQSTQTAPPTRSILSKSASIGIGTGCGAAFILLLVIASLLFLRKRKSKEAKSEPVMNQIRPRSQIDPAFHEQSDDFRNSSWSGYKSELAATEAASPTPTLTSGSLRESQSQQYRAYNTYRSMLSEVEGSLTPTDSNMQPGRVVHELPG